MWGQGHSLAWVCRWLEMLQRSFHCPVLEQACLRGSDALYCWSYLDSQSCHDFRHSLAVDGVKGLCQVYKRYVEISILFFTLFLELPCSKRHQPFQKPHSLSGKWPSVEEDSCKNLARYDYERNPSMIAARLPVSLSRTEVDIGGFHEVLKNDFLLLLGLKKARWAYVMALVLPPERLRLVWNLIQVLFLLKFFGKSAKDLFYLYWRSTSNSLYVDGLGCV